MNKKMITIASIIFALMFIGIMSILLSQINEYGNSISNSIGSFNSNIIMSELEPYNGKIVSGDTIINLINNKARLPDGSLMSIAVSVGPGTDTCYVYGLKRPATGSNCTYLWWSNTGSKDSRKYSMGVKGVDTSAQIYYDVNLASGDERYIPPFREYKGHLLYDWDASVVVGIYFKPV